MHTNLEGLTAVELSALRAALIPRAREARKKAIAAIHSEGQLKEAFKVYMAGPPKDLTEEEKLARSQALREQFEATLARFPDAYCKQMMANYFLEIESSIQQEMLRRSALRPSKGTKKSGVESG